MNSLPSVLQLSGGSPPVPHYRSPALCAPLSAAAQPHGVGVHSRRAVEAAVSGRVPSRVGSSGFGRLPERERSGWSRRHTWHCSTCVLVVARCLTRGHSPPASPCSRRVTDFSVPQMLPLSAQLRPAASAQPVSEPALAACRRGGCSQPVRLARRSVPPVCTASSPLSVVGVPRVGDPRPSRSAGAR